MHVAIFASRLLPVSCMRRNTSILSPEIRTARGACIEHQNEARVSAHASDWQGASPSTVEAQQASGDHASFLSSDPATLGHYTIAGYITIYGH